MAPELQGPGPESEHSNEENGLTREESIEQLMAKTDLSKGEATRLVDQIIERREDEAK